MRGAGVRSWLIVHQLLHESDFVRLRLFLPGLGGTNEPGWGILRHEPPTEGHSRASLSFLILRLVHYHFNQREQRPVLPVGPIALFTYRQAPRMMTATAFTIDDG